MLDVDNEFMDNHEDILDRFYQLFDGIFKVGVLIYLSFVLLTSISIRLLQNAHISVLIFVVYGP